MLRSLTIVLALSTTMFAAPVLARAAEIETQPAAVTAQQPEAAPAATPAVDDERSDLAAREAASKNLEDFRGGDEGVYIGSGVLAAVLVILLVVLLLR
jgi:hypothetical protein